MDTTHKIWLAAVVVWFIAASAWFVAAVYWMKKIRTFQKHYEQWRLELFKAGMTHAGMIVVTRRAFVAPASCDALMDAAIEIRKQRDALTKLPIDFYDEKKQKETGGTGDAGNIPQ